MYKEVGYAMKHTYDVKMAVLEDRANRADELSRSFENNQQREKEDLEVKLREFDNDRMKALAKVEL